MIQPYNASAAAISISASSTASTAVAVPDSGDSVRVVNEGPNVVFLAFGDSAVLATLPTGTQKNTCCPVLAGADMVFTRSPDIETYVSAICRASGTAVLTISSGEGE